MLIARSFSVCALAGLVDSVCAMAAAVTGSGAHWYWMQDGPFYGMPWVNFGGWLLTGTIVSSRCSRSSRRRDLRSAWRRPPFPSSFVYAVNGVMPLAMVARAELWWSFWPGLIAMATPVLLAVASGRVVSTVNRDPRITKGSGIRIHINRAFASKLIP